MVTETGFLPVEILTLGAFAAASALLILTPWPMVAFVISTTLAKGPRAGVVAVVGSTVASVLHLAIVAAGLAVLAAKIGEAFFGSNG